MNEVRILSVYSLLLFLCLFLRYTLCYRITTEDENFPLNTPDRNNTSEKDTLESPSPSNEYKTSIPEETLDHPLGDASDGVTPSSNRTTSSIEVRNHNDSVPNSNNPTIEHLSYDTFQTSANLEESSVTFTPRKLQATIDGTNLQNTEGTTEVLDSGGISSQSGTKKSETCCSDSASCDAVQRTAEKCLTDCMGKCGKKSTGRLWFVDKMLEGYDRRAWPTFGLTPERPTFVNVNMRIHTLGPINAAGMEYHMDIYLRQRWMDPRLSLAPYGITENMTMNADDIIKSIWKPDLFFRNVKSARYHSITVPNKLIRFGVEGDILLSVRITMSLSCRMSFRHYPLDTQHCSVLLGPYAQTTAQTVVKWEEEDPIIMEDKLEPPEFDYVKHCIGEYTRGVETGQFSFLKVTFVLHRQNGFHLIQTYMPTFLIVMISWVSFWLNVDATPARVTLGVTTLLTLTTVAYGVRLQLPPVSYIKAIDVWIGACSVMVFGALLEFTLVNYLSRSKLRPREFKNSINIFHWSRKANMVDGMEDMGNTHLEMAKNLKRARFVDRFSRVAFPLAFFIFNMVYWPYYIYVSDGIPEC